MSEKAQDGPHGGTLVDLMVAGDAAGDLRAEAANLRRWS